MAADPVPPLRPPAILVRLAGIGVVLGVLAVAFAAVGGWLSPARLTQDRIVDAFERNNGIHPGFRRNHAKGLCVAGSFTSTGQGVRLSKAAIFAPGSIPVTGRFAIAGGQPYAADAATSVRSLALRFHLPDGEEWRTGMNALPVFVVNTPEAFYAQLAAAAPDPATGRPDPAKMQAFLAAHPETVRAIALIRANPATSGFADATYGGLNAFRFVAADGTVTPVRWTVVPDQPVAPAPAAQAASADKNYLFDNLVARMGQGPLRWRLVVTLGQPGDPTADATLPWPAERERVELGTVTLDRVQAEGEENCRDVNFDPLVLPAGIEPSDDPLLSARSAAYAQSYTRRAGEPKEPSAVQAGGRTGGGS